VVVTPKAESLNAIGDTAQLAATVTNRRGGVLSGAEILWETDDSSVALVDSSGAVVARGAGRTRITAKVRDLTSSATILVRQLPARVIIAGDSLVRFRQGDTSQFAAIALDSRGHRIAQVSPIWRSADPNVATVDSLGTAIGREPGRTQLSVLVENGAATVWVDVELAASQLTLQSGEGQKALAGRRLAEPIVLQALARGGQPVPGATVTFVADGDGVVDPATATADREGRVRASWSLGSRAGPQRLLARITGVDSAFVIEAQADPVPGNVRVELVGSVPSGRAGATDQPVTLRYTDTTGVPLVGIPVTWTLPDGGSVDAAARTDSLGNAVARWTFSGRAGRQRLVAHVGNPRLISPFTVNATAETGPAATLSIVSGQSQRGPAGQALAKGVVLEVSDALGNGIPNMALSVRTAQGTLADTAPVTNAQGRATVKWTLGPTAGEQRAVVRVEGVDGEVTLLARATAGAPAKIAVTSVPPAKGAAGGALGIMATVTDAQGNPVQGAPVSFTTSAGTLSPTRSRTDATGKATVTWTPPRIAGDQKVTAVVTGTRVTATHTMRSPAAALKRRN
jgi:adhesin/invasin